MEVPREYHGISTEIQSAMEAPWTSHGGPMEARRMSQGRSMEVPRDDNNPSWKSHVCTMEVPWDIKLL